MKNQPEVNLVKWKLGIAVGVLLLLGLGYIQASPIGGAKISLLDENGKPLTDYGKIQYTVWTFDENGSIKTLQKGTLEKTFLFSGNTIKISSTALDRAKGIAKKIGSKTAFIGVDVWIVKNGRLYTLPPESFEVRSDEKNTFAKSIELKFNIKEARIKDLKALSSKSSEVQPMAHDVYYEWITIKQDHYENVMIPILIIHNNVWSNILGTADVGAMVQKYWGPDVTVAFGDQISKKVSFDKDSITVKVLGRSITGYYAGGDDITVPKEYSWGYVWIKGTVHYIYQKEYFCSLYCEPTGNERYFAKIDDFTVNRTVNGVKFIESGYSLGMPPYNFPDKWMKKSSGIVGSISNPVSISEFYGKIYAGADGHSFGVGIPVGVILKRLSGSALPDWFNVLTVGFSTGDYGSYVMLGHLKNKGPESQVTFYAMESNYTVEIPVHHWYGTTYEKVNVPIGLYVEADYS